MVISRLNNAADILKLKRGTISIVVSNPDPWPRAMLPRSCTDPDPYWLLAVPKYSWDCALYRCQCHGHGLRCDKVTGELCDCQNNMRTICGIDTSSDVTCSRYVFGWGMWLAKVCDWLRYVIGWGMWLAEVCDWLWYAMSSSLQNSSGIDNCCCAVTNNQINLFHSFTQISHQESRFSSSQSSHRASGLIGPWIRGSFSLHTDPSDARSWFSSEPINGAEPLFPETTTVVCP